MDPTSHDAQLRQAAFSHVNRLATLRDGVLDYADLAGGFDFGGDRIPLINPQRGIFKPRQMEHLLSMRTVFRGGVGESTVSSALRQGNTERLRIGTNSWFSIFFKKYSFRSNRRCIVPKWVRWAVMAAGLIISVLLWVIAEWKF